MSKGFQPMGNEGSAEAKRVESVKSDSPGVEGALSVDPDPHFKPWVFKFNGRRYETRNSWHVDLDPDYYERGKYKLNVWRIDPKTNHAFDGAGHGETMWGDQAIEFCLRRFYIAEVDGIKLTMGEKHCLLVYAFIALILVLSWLTDW